MEVAPGEAAVRFDVFFTRAEDDIVGKRRHGRLLVPADLLEVVADELLVETRLRSAGFVLSSGGAEAPAPAGRASPNSNFVSAMMIPRVAACTTPRS